MKNDPLDYRGSDGTPAPTASSFSFVDLEISINWILASIMWYILRVANIIGGILFILYIFAAVGFVLLVIFCFLVAVFFLPPHAVFAP